MGFSLKLTPMGSAVSLQLIGRWLHPRGRWRSAPQATIILG